MAELFAGHDQGAQHAGRVVVVLPRDRGSVAAAAEGMLERLGLQHAGGSRPERPFFLGAVERGPQVTNVHVYVIVTGTDEALAQHGFRGVAS